MGQIKFWNYLSSKNSMGRNAVRHRNVMVPGQEAQDRYTPGTMQAFNKSCIVANAYPLQPIVDAALTTAQTDLWVNGWNIQQKADVGNAQSIQEGVNGLICTTSADDEEGWQIRTGRTFTPAEDMKFHCSCRMQIASLETRILFGFGVKNADPITNLATVATVTDQITWHMDAAAGDGVLTTSCTGNGSILRNGVDLSAVTINQDFELGITGIFGATNSAEFWYNLNPGVGDPVLTKVEMTANQLAQFALMLTSPATTMCGVLQGLNSAAASRACIVKNLEFYVERA